MTERVNEYKLECYKKIMPLETRENVWLVENSVDGCRFVMHKLPVSSLKVYETLKDIHHPNIVEIFDVFCHDGFLYVIEAYIKGEPLSEVIAEKLLPQKQVLKIGKQLLSALCHLHKHNIIHRDIKPENIMYDKDGNAKLIDFNIARFFNRDKSADTTAKGSRHYAPPEQFGFTQSDYRTDIYALGVTLNELATGKLPEEKICRGMLGRIVRRCTELDPKRRYQTAAQTIRHIRQLETMRILFVFASAAIFGAAIFAALLRPGIRPEPKYAQTQTPENTPTETSAPPETSALPETPAPPDDLPSDTVEYEERIIRLKPPEWCPSTLLTENMNREFTETLADGKSKVDISLKKKKEQLTVSCTFSDNRTKQFSFEDVSRQQYNQLGYSINTDIENTSPEYEVVTQDIDQDGQEEFLIALAWRKLVDTPNPAYRYYLTEYCTVWVIYNMGQEEPVCSEPLYFEGGMPELQGGTVLIDSVNNTWYTFDCKQGTWLLC